MCFMVMLSCALERWLESWRSVLCILIACGLPAIVFWLILFWLMVISVNLVVMKNLHIVMSTSVSSSRMSVMVVLF